MLNYNFFFFLEQSYIDSHITSNIRMKFRDKYNLVLNNKDFKGIKGQVAALAGNIPESQLLDTIHNIQADLSHYKPFVTPLVLFYNGYWIYNGHMKMLKQFTMTDSSAYLLPILLNISTISFLLEPNIISKLITCLTYTKTD